MPYIPLEQRDHLAHNGYVHTEPHGAGPKNVGELTFVLYKVCHDYVQRWHADEPASFSDYAEVMAALECAKQEFYRKRVAPYEDIKIEENGLIY